jgi:hypothetical protein
VAGRRRCPSDKAAGECLDLLGAVVDALLIYITQRVLQAFSVASGKLVALDAFGTVRVGTGIAGFGHSVREFNVAGHLADTEILVKQEPAGGDDKGKRKPERHRSVSLV